MNLGLRDRIALVAGSSSGLGYAVAEALLAEGARVALNGRNPDRLAAAAARLAAGTGNEGRVAAFRADVSRAEDCAALVEQVHAGMGTPDILVCNAGGPPAGTFEQHGDQAWQGALDLSLLSTVHLCRAAVPSMRVRRWGRIICLTSVVARQPSPGLILSTMARAGVLGFAKSLADEVAAQGITVNVLCPGYFATERLRTLAQHRGTAAGRTVEQELEVMTQAVPARRIGEPAELAAVVAFLASEPARYLTGSVIGVDGGLARAIL